MATTINILLPLKAPTLNSIEVTPGAGTWNAGTYDFAVVASETNGSYNDSNPCRQSGLSNIITVNVAQNDKLTFNWTKNDTHNYTFIAHRKSTTLVWSAVYYYAVLNTSHISTVPSSYTSINWTPYLFTLFTDAKPFGLPVNKGIGRIIISGSGNFTIADINTALANSLAIEGQDYIFGSDRQLIGNFNLDMRTYGLGTFDISGKTVHLTGGINNIGSSLTIYSKIGSFGLGNGSPTILSIIPTNGTGGYLANCDLADISFINVFNTYGKYNIVSGYIKRATTDYQSITGVEFFTGCVLNIHTLSLKGTMSDNVVNFVFDYFYTSKSTRCTFYSNYERNPSAYVYIKSPINNAITEFVDCTFIERKNTGNVVLTPAALCAIGARYIYNNACGSNQYHYLKFSNTVNITLSDINNNRIPNVIIKCYDHFGTLVFSDVTDAFGFLSKEILVFFNSSIPSGPGGFNLDTNTVNTDYNPFSFEITKNGYQTYKSTIAITDKLNMHITMLEDVLKISAVTQKNCSKPGLNDGNISIEAAGGCQPYLYSIDGGNTLKDSGVFNNLANGVYKLFITDANNAVVSNIFIEIAYSGAELHIEKTSFTHPSITKKSGSVSIEAAGGVTPYLYSIDNGITWSDSGNFSDLGEGRYKIKIKDSVNRVTDALEVNLLLPAVDITYASVIKGSFVKNEIDGNISIIETLTGKI